jgi:hypothetical protein
VIRQARVPRRSHRRSLPFVPAISDHYLANPVAHSGAILSSPLELLPQDLKEQIMQHLGTEDLASLGDTSTTMLNYFRQQAQALVDQAANLLTELPNHFGGGQQ